MSAIGNIIGDITGTNQQANAAVQAAQIQANAANNASQLLQQNLSPYMNVGTQSLPQYLNLLGLGSGGQAGMQQALQNMPGYQFALQQGLKGAANSASGSGLNLSGAQQKGLANYATGLAQQNYQNYLGNLQSAVGLGQNSAAGVASGVGNYMTQAANAQAAGQVAQGNAQSNAINSLMGLGQGAAGIYALGNYAPAGGTSLITRLFG